MQNGYICRFHIAIYDHLHHPVYVLQIKFEGIYLYNSEDIPTSIATTAL